MSTTDNKLDIAVIIGSLRGGSVARKIAQNTLHMFSDEVTAHIVEIRDLPLYDFDYDDPEITDKPTPKEYTAFRETIKKADGVLFVTPENNRTIPACLKNAIDIGSKPNNDVAWKNLPAAIISHSVGRMGGYSSQKNLKLALSYFDMPIQGQPEVFLGQSPSLLNEDGSFLSADTTEFVQGHIDRFIDLVKRNPRPKR
ncbi:NADPH:quinone oxidoreductase 1 [Corynebacterium kutscheri]|uniref:NADPH:quinone oxidoreductase 1 n=1 Tax=Corynebacterium kutscheri TaxID=35755 RepID=A0A0F6R1Q0_9CORY|nr:NADPH-dependent FMN reductase [Corynebacterium kutscheri]AKE41173.1 putative flavoprotein [Corynebacterium kutscheri]VEH08449.1 NADPH:quinone oxidoreductase 1 [Corynebacterium kutscheri]VEH09495.1 NADPH:quinone oxidoreductase 1 [Corynebacterium kutscheri]VEH79578.1 NADPH:quinone oxidoreductase 1 [Corynebacterium kutscheri]